MARSSRPIWLARLSLLVVATGLGAPARGADLAEKPVLRFLRAGQGRPSGAPRDPGPSPDWDLAGGKPVLRLLRAGVAASASSPADPVPCWGEKPVTRFLRKGNC